MNRPLAAVSLVIIAGLALSGIRPYDRTTWILEVFPVIVFDNSEYPCGNRPSTSVH